MTPMNNHFYLILLSAGTALSLAFPSLALASGKAAGKKKAAGDGQSTLSDVFKGFRVVHLERGKRNHLLMRATLDGEALLLGVDTGAPVSVLNLRSRRRFSLGAVPPDSGIPTTMRIGGETVEIGMARNLQANGVRFGSGPVALFDLSRITSGELSTKSKVASLDGIFGADILLQHRAVISCAHPRLYLPEIDSPDLGPLLTARGYEAVPLGGDAGHLTVPCTINRTRYRLIVDTGAFATLLDTRLLKKQGIKSSELPFKTRNLHGDAATLHVARIKSLKIGNVDLRNRKIGSTDLARFAGTHDDNGEAPIGGLLGNELLTQCRAYIDLNHGKLYLRKP